jgi:hypothetical protein
VPREQAGADAWRFACAAARFVSNESILRRRRADGLSQRTAVLRLATGSGSGDGRVVGKTKLLAGVPLVLDDMHWYRAKNL